MVWGWSVADNKNVIINSWVILIFEVFCKHTVKLMMGVLPELAMILFRKCTTQKKTKHIVCFAVRPRIEYEIKRFVIHANINTNVYYEAKCMLSFCKIIIISL